MHARICLYTNELGQSNLKDVRFLKKGICGDFDAFDAITIQGTLYIEWQLAHALSFTLLPLLDTLFTPSREEGSRRFSSDNVRAGVRTRRRAHAQTRAKCDGVRAR